MELTRENNNEQDLETAVSMPSKMIAWLFSYLFHPIFIPIYVTLFLLYIHPSAFSGFSDFNKRQTLVIVILNLIFFPLLSVVLLRALGFVESIFLRTQKDRIIPYIACGIFFFWAYTVFKQQSAYPLLLSSYVLGIFFASSAALLANIYYKISMHAIGMGGWLGIFFVIMHGDSMLMSLSIAIVILLTGFVCTSRLLLKSHNPFDIYSGIAIGIVTQLMAAYFIF